MTEENRIERDRAGLRAAINIMTQWQLAEKDQAEILRVPPELLKNPDSATGLSTDQLERLSYLLNIHAELRELFQNPENHGLYINSRNQNSPFDGRSPLELIQTGGKKGLDEVFRHLEIIKYGQ
jgi:hypothetical protein|tara:strand:- start:453 stop:824 length:372 start_codon:yes stop_codon:yes gene_type:complete